ncbi:RES family NAD+ phosphorylase [Robiginitalea aurantiaca]|uniref:RES family NAD+ phosphorylase n=1 Tax=Robiginitalea aurantiaca TaxID=3056915 RepID=A0ABT7WDC3_9FLAO|nr:RES family NAD+ phosphorylase [Robiginitalea aurantiaca]MDM9630910.1 RES family NAD+ phosphorylase [Robiginitalea aurantiaca]
MIVYRLSKKTYSADLSGIGAEKFGGRWNNKGTRMIYTAQSRALANLEVAVHVPLHIVPNDYFLTAIEIPDALIRNYPEKRLESVNWKTHPPSDFTQREGDAFIREGKALVLKVPSAIVQGDYNYLINPLHKEIHQAKILSSEPFIFDQRLFRP